MKIIFLLTVILLSSCITNDERIGNPQPSDIAGKWESLSVLQLVPYVLLDVNSAGEGIMIATGGDAAMEVLKFEFVQSLRTQFEVHITSSIRDEAEPVNVMGSIARGQLCFEIPEDDRLELELSNIYKPCFTKFEEVEGLRAQALELLRSVK